MTQFRIDLGKLFSNLHEIKDVTEGVVQDLDRMSNGLSDDTVGTIFLRHVFPLT